MCGKSSADSIKHFRTVASYFSASSRWWATAFLYFKKRNARTRRYTWSNALNAYEHFVETINVGNILFFGARVEGRTENKNKKKTGETGTYTNTHIHVDERKLLRRKMGNIFCRSPYSTVRSGYIIQAIRDGNADIVTSIPLEKETPAALRERKKREK